MENIRGRRLVDPIIRGLLGIGLVALGLAGTAACGSTDSATTAAADDSAAARPVETDARPQIVALGDSLTAGLGIRPDEAYPAILQRKLTEAGYPVTVVNAGVSGDTSAGGLRRLDWTFEGDTRVLILALGANDGLRGVPVEEMRRNLSTIIERAEDRGVDVLLAGMEAPPNFGPFYTASYRQIFRDLADQHDVVFVPFLLQGVAGVPRLNQPDGIHPTAEGARMIADHLWPALEPMVEASLRHD